MSNIRDAADEWLAEVEGLNRTAMVEWAKRIIEGLLDELEAVTGGR